MIAIHHRQGSFSEKWIEYCKQHKVDYRIVDCYASDIIRQVEDCSGLMWHWAHWDHLAVLFARQLTYSLEHMGIKVFPDSKTCWHYDDKVGQKYLLEAIGAPLVPTYIFYNKLKALGWAEQTSYPKVFKLRGGASSQNVKIVRDSSAARHLIKKAFRSGFKARDRINLLKERIWQFKRDKNMTSFLNIRKGIARLFIPTVEEVHLPIERDYAYFQDFIPDNDHDIRIIVIGHRAFAIKRMVRQGDFRASGSGQIIYEPDQMPKTCIELAFSLSSKLMTQCLAYDFIFLNGRPLLTEISYAFAQKGYLSCPGYWDDRLKWHEGTFYPEFFMIEDFINGITHHKTGR